MEPIKRAVKAVGGAELAKLIGVSPQAVSQWTTGKRPVPAGRCLLIERATDGKVRAVDLRPDVFGDQDIHG